MLNIILYIKHKNTRQSNVVAAFCCIKENEQWALFQDMFCCILMHLAEVGSILSTELVRMF